MSKRNREKRVFRGVMIPYLLRTKYRLNDEEIDLIIRALRKEFPVDVYEFLEERKLFGAGKNRNPQEKAKTLEILQNFLEPMRKNSLFVTLYTGAIVVASAKEYLQAINIHMEVEA